MLFIPRLFGERKAMAKVQEQALRCLRSAIAKPLHFATAAMADLEATALPLPPAFLAFLRQNDLDPSIYAAAHDLPRYVRFEHWKKSSLKAGLLMVRNLFVGLSVFCL